MLPGATAGLRGVPCGLGRSAIPSQSSSVRASRGARSRSVDLSEGPMRPRRTVRDAKPAPLFRPSPPLDRRASRLTDGRRTPAGRHGGLRPAGQPRGLPAGGLGDAPPVRPRPNPVSIDGEWAPTARAASRSPSACGAGRSCSPSLRCGRLTGSWYEWNQHPGERPPEASRMSLVHKIGDHTLSRIESRGLPFGTSAQRKATLGRAECLAS